jgi:hypothetical protein
LRIGKVQFGLLDRGFLQKDVGLGRVRVGSRHVDLLACDVVGPEQSFVPRQVQVGAAGGGLRGQQAGAGLGQPIHVIGRIDLDEDVSFLDELVVVDVHLGDLTLHARGDGADVRVDEGVVRVLVREDVGDDPCEPREDDEPGRAAEQPQPPLLLVGRLTNGRRGRRRRGSGLLGAVLHGFRRLVGHRLIHDILLP